MNKEVTVEEYELAICMAQELYPLSVKKRKEFVKYFLERKIS